ncbi:hypothetical protein ACDA63_15985 [Uliginosibacterium sp. sgz301328]|uniref:hypothetical protein n=1 Tax=Uliginosibacterium sp. sgz301328 TaxID=3243764 RepID=UPI00359F0731
MMNSPNPIRLPSNEHCLEPDDSDSMLLACHERSSHKYPDEVDEDGEDPDGDFAW